MPTANPKTNRDILPFLESEAGFRKLSAFFAEKSLSELFESGDDEDLRQYVKVGTDLLLDKCHRTIACLSGSPIERVFARSVMLSFLRNGMPLVFAASFRDTLVDLREYRQQLGRLDEFTDWYRRHYGSSVVSSDYLDEEVASGRMPAEERPWVEELLLLYRYLPCRTAWHVSLQPRFPNLLDNRGSRPDLLFWKPSSRDRHLVVECDGYEYHKSKDQFVVDRQKDRALKALGFDVFRFAGRQINLQPMTSGAELFAFLDDWCSAGKA